MPIIQVPDDIVTMQEIIWETRPQVVIETGFARGGSAILYSSILTLIGDGIVVSVDIDIRAHNRAGRRGTPLGRPRQARRRLVDGTGDPGPRADADPGRRSRDGRPRLNHTHQHVLEELRLYGPLVTEGQFLVVSDTVMEDIPPQTHRPREWGPGNNPKTALQEYLRETDRFEPDPWYNSKVLITSSRGGYLRCVPR